MLCLALGVVITCAVLAPLLLIQGWVQIGPDGDPQSNSFYAMFANVSRSLSDRPYSSLFIVALATSLYTVAACRIWRHYNPIPVVTILFPIAEGLLVVRRAIEPALGQLAFPGGYIDDCELWQAAAVRELREETGIDVSPDALEIFSVSSTRRGHLLVVYVLVKQGGPQAVPPPVRSDEVSELRVLMRPIPFVWSQDTEAARQYFANRPAAALAVADTIPYPSE